jgi:hypothetical protein
MSLARLVEWCLSDRLAPIWRRFADHLREAEMKVSR